MRVKNETDHGILVSGHGVVPGGEEATVKDSPAVRQLIKAGALSKQESGSGTQTSRGGSGS